MSARAGYPSGLERMVVATVNVAPTYVSEQAGIEPGFPEPGAANTGDAELDTDGTIRVASGNEPSIDVKVMERGLGPTIQPPNIANIIHDVGQALTGQNVTIVDLVGGIKRALTGSPVFQRSTPVSRFGIKRSDSDTVTDDADYIGVSEDFYAWDDVGAMPTGAPVGSPADSDSDWDIQDWSPMVKAADETLRLFILTKRSASNYALEVKWFDPAQHKDTDGWQHFYTKLNLQSLLPASDATCVITRIDACRDGDEIKIVLVGSDTGVPARFWVFRFRGLTTATAALESIDDSATGEAVTVWSHSTLGSSGGVACRASRGGMVVAQSLATLGIWGGLNFRSLVVQRSPDCVTWGTKQTYAATGGITVTGGNTINDAASLFPTAKAGDQIRIDTPANKKTVTIITWAAGAITVGAGLLTDEAVAVAGTFTITAAHAEAISDYYPVAMGGGLTQDETVTATHWPNEIEGYAVTTKGRIFRSFDSGQTWQNVQSPCSADRTKNSRPFALHCVGGASTSAPVTADTIALNASAHKITDSANSLPVCAADARIVVTGFDGTPSFEATVTGTPTTGEIIFTVADGVTLVDEAAGADVTVRIMPWIWCGGEHAVLLRQTTDGVFKVWRGLPRSAFDPEDLDTYGDNSFYYADKGQNDLTFRAMTWTAQAVGYVVGDKGSVMYVHGLKSSQVGNRRALAGTGHYRAVYLDPTGDGTLYLAGDVGVHSNKETTPESNRTTRFLKLTNASLGKDHWSGTTTFLDVAAKRVGDPGVVGLAVRSTSLMFAVDSAGTVMKYNGTTWSVISQLYGGTATSIQATSDDNLFIGGSDEFGGLIWRSTDAGVTWIAERLTIPVRAIHFFSASIGLAFGTGAVANDSFTDDRAWPALHASDTGAVLLACVNVTKAQVELYRAENANSPFFLVSRATAASLADAVRGLSWVSVTNQTVPVNAPRPSFCDWPNGEIYCTIGQEGICSLDDGRTWLPRADPSLAIPLGRIAVDSDYIATTLNRSRSSIGWGGGRIWSTVRKKDVSSKSSALRTYVARAWDATHQRHYMPVLPNVPLWLGVDDVKGTWAGDPAPGDTYTIAPRFCYPARHLLIASPQDAARTKDNTADWVHEWDRQHADVIASEGAGTHWRVHAGSLHGTRHRYAVLQLSVPGYTDPTFPTDPDDYTEMLLSADVTSAMTIAAVETPNVIRLTLSTPLIPEQFKPGLRTYYAAFSSVPGVAYRIIGNTNDRLMIENQSGTFTGTVTVFSDRMCCLGTTATNGVVEIAIDGSVALGTQLQFARFVRLITPIYAADAGTTPYEVARNGQYIYGSYRQIGTAILGASVLPSYTGISTATDPRRRHDAQTWRAEVSSITQRGLSSVGNTEHFGRPPQRWRLPYMFAQWWDRDMRLNPLLPELFQPFSIVFRANDLSSVELVQLTETPEAANQFHDRWADTWALQEIT